MEQKRFPTFSKRFSELRKDMTQGEFAEFLGISRPTVGFYENGTRIPDALVLRQISEKCQVSTDWLLGLSNFRTEVERSEANDLYDGIMKLMPLEFDENDKKRVNRVLSSVIDGFRVAMCDYNAYTWYENAAILITEAIATVASCMEIAVKKVDASQEERNKLFGKIDKIINMSTASSYRELGYFFNAYRKSIMEVLKAGNSRIRDYGFAFELDALKSDDGKEK